jgi:hypothetical protein
MYRQKMGEFTDFFAPKTNHNMLITNTYKIIALREFQNFNTLLFELLTGYEMNRC